MIEDTKWKVNRCNNTHRQGRVFRRLKRRALRRSSNMPAAAPRANHSHCADSRMSKRRPQPAHNVSDRSKRMRMTVSGVAKSTLPMSEYWPAGHMSCRQRRCIDAVSHCSCTGRQPDERTRRSNACNSREASLLARDESEQEPERDGERGEAEHFKDVLSPLTRGPMLHAPRRQLFECISTS